MNLKLSYPRGRARHATALGAALACSLGCFAAHAQTDQGEKRTRPPQESPSKPGSPPVAAQPDLAPAAAPLPSAPEPSASSWEWPRVLLVCAAGVELVGSAVALGNAIAAEDAQRATEEAWPRAITMGCQGGMASCATVNDGTLSDITATGAANFAFFASTSVAFILVGVSLFGYELSALNDEAASKSATIQVKIAPTPGGVVIQGTF